MVRKTALLSALMLSAVPVWAAEGKAAKTARKCPFVLAAYAAADGAVAVEFAGDEARSFRVLVDGIDGAFDGFVFPADDGAGELAVVLENCPEGDVTGADLDACRIWQGPATGADAGGMPTALPGAGDAASPGLRFDGFAVALSGSQPFRDAGLAPVSFETLTLSACQE